MRAIKKGVEPTSLTTHRRTDHCNYANYPDKEGLRRALCSDQRHLCCYCMGTIEATSVEMKIEHWRPQDGTATDLEYWNLLGACPGGEGLPNHLQHCDTYKGMNALKFSPADPDHHIEQRVFFELDGTIRSSDDDFDNQLKDVLNLNVPFLKNRRKAVIDSLAFWLREYRKIHHRGPDAAVLKRKRAFWDAPSGSLEPYARVALWWVDQRLT